MSKKISLQQQSGQNAVQILKSRMLMKRQKIEFAFVEVPQQDDFGLDGILNIFVDNIYQNINPICQVKGTKNERIKIEKEDLEDLKSKNTLSVIFGVNNTLGDNSKVGYFFPQCETLKTKKVTKKSKIKLWETKKVNNFPHFLENTEQSKIEFWQNIQKFEDERMNKINQKLNSLDLQNLGKLKLHNDFEYNTVKKIITHKTQESVKIKIELNFENKTAEENINWQKNLTLFLNNQKDEFQIEKNLITNFEQLDGWVIGNNVSKFTEDGIILCREVLWEGEVMFKKNEKNIVLNCRSWQSVEQNCLVLEYGNQELDDFSFRLYLIGYSGDNSKISEKIEFKTDPRKSKNLLKINEFYSFWESQSENENLEIWMRNNFSFGFLCDLKLNGLVKGFPQREIIEHFAIFKSIFAGELEENNVEIKMPDDYSEEDKVAICELGEIVNKLKPELENLVVWRTFETEEFEKYVNHQKSVLVGNSFREKLPIKAVVFQNKKFTLYSQISKVKDFDVNERKILFEVKSLNLEIQSTE